MKQVVSLEKMLIEDGIKIIKLWFSIDNEEQKNRLEERKTDPLKNWKLSTIDLQAQLKWDDYTYYKDQMFKTTGKDYCPCRITSYNVCYTKLLRALFLSFPLITTHGQ